MFYRLAQAVVGLSLLVPLSFAAVIVTFDGPGAPAGDASYPGNGNLGNAADPGFDNPLMPLGVEFIGDVNTRFLATNTGDAIGPLSGNYLQINSVGDNPATPSTIRISFDRNNNNSRWAVGSLLFVDLQDGQENIRLQAYDRFGSPLGTPIDFLVGVGTVSFASAAGLTASDRVDYIEILDLGGDGYILDNLNFELASETPEPSTLVLVGVGFAAVSLLRRRR